MPSLSTSVVEAVARLKAGKLVALPTETVYGLAADACNESAVQAVFALKGRPSSNPLIIHVFDAEMARRYVIWNELAESLAVQHWPGPLTLVLPKREDCPVATSVSAGGDTLAIRMPSHPLAREVLKGYDGGIAAPSANRSGKISPTQPAHVMSEFPTADLLVLDGGSCTVGLESTVVDCTGVQLVVLRPGSVLIDAASGQSEGGILKSPGMLESHYAPNATVRLNALEVREEEALLAFGGKVPAGASQMLNLSESGDLEEAAANLFAMLRELDQSGSQSIAVMPIPEKGVGAAINDRLRRAAADRSKV